MGLEILPGYGRRQQVVGLFSEYTEMLVKSDPAFAQYLAIQNYDSEIKDLGAKYGPPGGRLYIALYNGEAAGCIALRRLDGSRCEMKRLYVKESFRGKGIGGALVDRLIADARQIGYSQMLLDTLPVLKSAIRLYKAKGFYLTGNYNDSPIEASVFMRLDL